MAAGINPTRRRAPVVRVRRRPRAEARPTSASTATASRRRTRSVPPPGAVGGATSGDGSATDASRTRPPTARAERAERRTLLQRLAETERLLEVAEGRADAAEGERDELLRAQGALYDQGTQLWQNVWHRDDVSSVLTFPTSKSVLCDSVEHRHGGNSMPGVHAVAALDKGHTTQSIWLKGMGYTLVGLVTSEAEKAALRHRAGDDFTKMPLMTTVYSAHGDERKGDIFTIEVDMVERRAELYISNENPPPPPTMNGDDFQAWQASLHGGPRPRLLEPHAVWENLPEKVWVAVAFKRNSGREAVMMPCIHWNIAAK